jgi:hypothetical protein
MKTLQTLEIKMLVSAHLQVVKYKQDSQNQPGIADKLIFIQAKNNVQRQGYIIQSPGNIVEVICYLS